MIFLVGTDTLEVFMVLLLLLFYSLYSRGCSAQQPVHKMTLGMVVPGTRSWLLRLKLLHLSLKLFLQRSVPALEQYLERLYIPPSCPFASASHSQSIKSLSNQACTLTLRLKIK
jgi:hypothetical protein